MRIHGDPWRSFMQVWFAVWDAWGHADVAVLLPIGRLCIMTFWPNLSPDLGILPSLNVILCTKHTGHTGPPWRWGWNYLAPWQQRRNLERGLIPQPHDSRNIVLEGNLWERRWLHVCLNCSAFSGSQPLNTFSEQLHDSKAWCGFLGFEGMSVVWNLSELQWHVCHIATCLGLLAESWPPSSSSTFGQTRRQRSWDIELNEYDFQVQASPFDLSVQQHREYRILSTNRKQKKKNKLEPKSSKSKIKTKSSSKPEKNQGFDVFYIFLFFFFFPGDSSCRVVLFFFNESLFFFSVFIFFAKTFFLC